MADIDRLGKEARQLENNMERLAAASEALEARQEMLDTMQDGTFDFLTDRLIDDSEDVTSLAIDLLGKAFDGMGEAIIHRAQSGHA